MQPRRLGGLESDKPVDQDIDTEKTNSESAPPAEPRQLDEADKEVLQTFIERIRQQVLAEVAEKQREAAGSNGDSSGDG